MSVGIVVALGGFSFGVASMWGLRFFVRRHHLRSAHNEAQDIIENAQLNAEEHFNELKTTTEADGEEARRKLDEELSQKQPKLDTWKEDIEEREERLKQDLKKIESDFNRQRSRTDSFKQKVDSKESNLRNRQEQFAQTQRKLIDVLAERSGDGMAALLEELKNKLIQDSKLATTRWAQEAEELAYQSSERDAKNLLSSAISRFARPYCPERGSGYVAFGDEKVKERVLGAENERLPMIEKACGVDLIYDSNYNSVSVSGFDPVRRELARSTLERLIKERRVDEQTLNRVVSQAKKTLFQNIRRDGRKIAKEMNLENLSSEILDMMGALRYRYSFTQNQYFHCGEVGYLCGLLAAEVEVLVKEGRRAGMLHDIGKAMDHSRDGGHAVLGADFIEQNGEADHIVHAVRAHHYDETPSTNLAHLVIAADAISGARPGARRSTVNTYMQKMEDLQGIARSFEGVSDTHILNAGREVRVSVNGQTVNDWKALELSQQIAKKIEDECNYPGTIKVTVVRETQSVEYAK